MLTDSPPRIVNNWAKFRLLMWKNFLLMSRAKRKNIFEILIPVIFFALLVLIRIYSKPNIYPKPFDYEPLRLVNSSWPSGQKNFEWVVAYSPQNKVLDGIMNQVQQEMNLTRIDGYDNADKLNARLAKEANRPLAGIIFDESISMTSTQLPKDLKYTLRFPAELRNPLAGGDSKAEGSSLNWITQYLYPTLAFGGPRNLNDSSGGVPPNYYEEKFVSLQSIISLGFIKTVVDNLGRDVNQVPKVTLQRFSYPPAKIDRIVDMLKIIVSLFFLLSFLYPCINNVKVSQLEIIQCQE